MKTRIIALACILGISNIHCQKMIAQRYTSPKWSTREGSTEQAPLPIYFTAFAQVVMPQSSYKEYSKVKGGFGIEAGMPFKANSSLSAGLEFSGILSDSKKDLFKGIDVKTTTSLITVCPLIRWTPRKNLNLKPFITISSGLMIANTKTTSEIVDEPTFTETVLYGDETEVETVTHKKSNSSNLTFGAGVGFIVKKNWMIGVHYQHTNPLNYINTDEVYIKDNTIDYHARRIPLDMIAVTIGFTNWGSH